MYRTRKQLDEVSDSTHFTPPGDSSGWHLLRRMTVDAPAHQLTEWLSDGHNIALMHGHFADIQVVDERTTRWTVTLPVVPNLVWDSEIVEVVPGQAVRWKSKPGGSLENSGELTMRPAPGQWGTEVTLYMRFNPPAGPLGDLVTAMNTAAPKIIADKSLRRFKAMIETGEIPTTSGQPAGRHSGHDKE